MIEFKGEISQKVQLDRDKLCTKQVVWLFAISWLIIIALTCLFGFIFDFIKDMLIDISILSIFMCGIILMIIFVPEKTKLRFKISHHVTILDDKISLVSTPNIGGEDKREKPIKKVKKVLDYGDVYYIIFKFGDITNAWICQKDNITQGTLEDFENVFKSKIVRKLKK